MVAIVDFLYFGEANVNQESLEAFLGLAEELRLKGLTGSAELKYEEYKTKEPPKTKQESIPNMSKPMNICNPTETPNTYQVKVVAEELDEQISSMMNITEHLVTK